MPQESGLVQRETMVVNGGTMAAVAGRIFYYIWMKMLLYMNENVTVYG